MLTGVVPKVLGEDKFFNGLKVVFDGLQYPKLNKQVRFGSDVRVYIEKCYYQMSVMFKFRLYSTHNILYKQIEIGGLTKKRAHCVLFTEMCFDVAAQKINRMLPNKKMT